MKSLVSPFFFLNHSNIHDLSQKEKSKITVLHNMQAIEIKGYFFKKQNMNPRRKCTKIHHKVCLTQWPVSGTDLDPLGHMT